QAASPGAVRGSRKRRDHGSVAGLRGEGVSGEDRRAFGRSALEGQGIRARLLHDRHQPAARCGIARVPGDPRGTHVMGFLTPWFLAGVAAVGLPIWVHLLKRHKTDPKLFPSLMFFEQREQSSVRHRRLEHLLLFALRTLMILLLALLFANPFINRS